MQHDDHGASAHGRHGLGNVNPEIPSAEVLIGIRRSITACSAVLRPRTWRKSQEHDNSDHGSHCFTSSAVTAMRRSPGESTAVNATTASVHIPPKITEGTSPSSFAAAPDSNAP